jgi:3-oxoacyl-[acyl-carrier protein] reductase
MKLLENKIALITGGARGIGAAIVRRFAEQGATVAFTYISENSAEIAQKLVDELTANGATIVAFRSDASNFAEAENLIGEVTKTFGRLDIVVNNAGITRDNLMLRMTEQQWDEVMNSNLKSVFNMTKHALRPMLKQRSGSIINMSSVVGVFGNAGQANYAASKAGIFGFSKSIAKEYGNRNIRCNAIAPGYIETEMTHGLTDEVKANFMKSIPLARMGSGEEVADACVFLASDMSRYVSGQTLSVCGALNC